MWCMRAGEGSREKGDPASSGRHKLTLAFRFPYRLRGRFRQECQRPIASNMSRRSCRTHICRPRVSIGRASIERPARMKIDADAKTGPFGDFAAALYVAMIGANAPDKREAEPARASPVPRCGVGKVSGAIA